MHEIMRAAILGAEVTTTTTFQRMSRSDANRPDDAVRMTIKFLLTREDSEDADIRRNRCDLVF